MSFDAFLAETRWIITFKHFSKKDSPCLITILISVISEIGFPIITVAPVKVVFAKQGDSVMLECNAEGPSKKLKQ